MTRTIGVLSVVKVYQCFVNIAHIVGLNKNTRVMLKNPEFWVLKDKEVPVINMAEYLKEREKRLEKEWRAAVIQSILDR